MTLWGLFGKQKKKKSQQEAEIHALKNQVQRLGKTKMEIDRINTETGVKLDHVSDTIDDIAKKIAENTGRIKERND